MLDARMQARLSQNYKDAAVGYANASAAAMNALAQQALDFWRPADSMVPAPRRDHLSWFNPHGTESHWGRKEPEPAPFNPWLAFAPFTTWAGAVPASTAFKRPETAPQLMAMAWAFAPFATFWGTAMRGPTFAWPMAYSMMAQGVPDSVAWPAAEANAAVLDATATITEQAQQAFASYQSSGGFAMAHVWAPKQELAAFAALTPFIAMWPMSGPQQSLF